MHDQLSGGAIDLVNGVSQPAAAAGEPGDALRREACTLIERAQQDDRQQRWEAAVLSGDLLDRSRRALAGRQMRPSTFARILRSMVLVRSYADLADLPPDPVLDELVTHTTEHGLASHNAAAQALRGNLAQARGRLDEAMDAAVNAMVTVELTEPSLERVFALNDIATLLLRLGAVGMAAQSYANAAADAERAGLLREYIIVLGNRVMSEVVHGLALERTNTPELALDHFATAVDLAREGLKRWQRADPPPDLREDHAAGFRAALAFDSCDDELESQLRGHLTSVDAECRLVPGIALARRLTTTGRRDEARELLAELADWPSLPQAQPQLRVSVIRHLHEAETPGEVPRYIRALEAELWSHWVARALDLRARLERERLRREHAPIRALASEDPLTGLPNRRALDELLTKLAGLDQPGAVAMVDLDGLRMINRRGRHVDGDATLRAVAVAMRGTLPATDCVVRYGGDEFVLLMPGDDVETATAKTRRVVAAIAALPPDRGFGVTASVGIVAVHPGESVDSILVRADDAMNCAKEDGGNRVNAA